MHENSISQYLVRGTTYGINRVPSKLKKPVTLTAVSDSVDARRDRIRPTINQPRHKNDSPSPAPAKRFPTCTKRIRDRRDNNAHRNVHVDGKRRLMLACSQRTE
ncbi:hypothetical protein U1Q18_018941 [Sarracenia purpurea var. burkii]